MYAVLAIIYIFDFLFTAFQDSTWLAFITMKMLTGWQSAVQNQWRQSPRSVSVPFIITFFFTQKPM